MHTGQVPVAHDEELDAGPRTKTAIVRRNGVVNSDQEKADALAEHLESQFIPTDDPSGPVHIAHVTKVIGVVSYRPLDEPEPREVIEILALGWGWDTLRLTNSSGSWNRSRELQINRLTGSVFLDVAKAFDRVLPLCDMLSTHQITTIKFHELPMDIRGGMLGKSLSRVKCGQCCLSPLVKVSKIAYTEMTKEYERPGLDDLYGVRVHSWVAVLPGKRDITETFFIEPPSGVKFDQSNANYLGIESMWNHTNFWINLQVCSQGCKVAILSLNILANALVVLSSTAEDGEIESLKFDLSDLKCWEHLLPGEPWTSRKTDPSFQVDDNSPELTLQEKHLDMPTSWVSRLNIPLSVYEKRYPHGHKTVNYKKARLELFAPYLQCDGLISRITSFRDYAWEDPEWVYKYYNHREDLLYFSLQNLKKESIVEEFLPGREDSLKEHSYYLAQSHVEHERSMKFYHKARMDGMESIHMEPCHMTQHFKDREDFCYHRHVIFAPRDKTIAEGPKRTVLSLSEKYHRNPTKPADKDVAERVFAVAENRMTLKFHYDKGNVSANILEFTKPPISELGDRLTFNPAMMYIYQVDPLSPAMKNLQLFYILEELLKAEEQSLFLVRSMEDEARSWRLLTELGPKPTSRTAASWACLRARELWVCGGGPEMGWTLRGSEVYPPTSDGVGKGLVVHGLEHGRLHLCARGVGDYFPTRNGRNPIPIHMGKSGYRKVHEMLIVRGRESTVPKMKYSIFDTLRNEKAKKAMKQKEKHKRTVNVDGMRYLRKVCGKTHMDRVSNEWVLKEFTLKGNPIGQSEQSVLHWFGHFERIREQQLQEQSKREVETDVDYLGPYLARLGDPESLSHDEALQMRESCLSDFKQLLVDRANHIQTMFEKESNLLQSKHRWYEDEQDALSRSEEEKYFEFRNRTTFLLHSLEIRLNRHRDLAPQRYLALEACLNADKRLHSGRLS
uniref:Uncharacterized protein n=1 Tax=Timema bartmani TaxID=61472 RepID=A0A7R9FA23_9NEOP|nr:unnamed protein product [Timema bartmani]